MVFVGWYCFFKFEGVLGELNIEDGDVGDCKFIVRFFGL